MSSVNIRSGEVRIWYEDSQDETDPDADPDAVIPPSSIATLAIDERADNWLDEGSIDADLSLSGAYDVDLGDRVQFVADLSDGMAIDWTGRIRGHDQGREHAGRGTLGADVHDWVGDILSDRTVTASWVGDDAGRIIREICERTASEVDASPIPDLGVTTDQFCQGEDAWDVVCRLAAKSDALLVQDGLQLRADPIADLPFAFTLEDHDYSMPWTTETDTDVNNIVRVNSGVARQQEQAQETQTGWQRVTETSRLTHRLRARKSEIHSVELYVDAVTDDEDLSVRLQADQDGAPVDIGNTDSDIASASWDTDTLPNDDWQAFFLPEHTLPDRDPWLIIESDGDGGHDVGVDGDGVPTFRSYYPHPLTYEDSDPGSVAEYGPRQISVERENLETITAVEDAVQAELARRAWPSKTVEFDAKSPRAHALTPGDRIDVNRPEEDAVGEFIVVEVSRTLSGIHLETQITANWRRGLLAPMT